ncbi:sugar transferase [Flavobacterium sp. PL12]|uniref:sugar transferase n=1 Tax=Flavobacterium sp. PL12 TaxID=3071718 RepID=UPI00319E46A0
MISKRIFDFLFSFLGILVLNFLLIGLFILASYDTCSNGFFMQDRIGKFGKTFKIIKFKTIHPVTRKTTFIGMFLRKLKLDELPQLINILKGDMSFVGPRPDIPGYYDILEGDATKILELKPGLTSEASIKYFNEEQILANKKNPFEYNNSVLFPDKLKMNVEYYYNRSFLGDIKIIFKTIYRYIK